MAALAALLLAFVVLVSLGTWQVERLQWKEALIAEIEARRAAPSLTLAAWEGLAKPDLEGEYRRMSVTGRFDYAHEQYFFATEDGAVGYHVYVPLVLTDGRTLFVNRGFVPEKFKVPATRLSGQIAGEITVNGLARAELGEKPSWLVPDNEPARQVYFWKDLSAMAAQAGVQPDKLVRLFLDADAASNPGDYPVGGVTQIDLPNNHLAYAVTWYGLALVMVVIAVLAFRKRLR